jgi:hypothetical protein
MLVTAKTVSEYQGGATTSRHLDLVSLRDAHQRTLDGKQV